MKREHDKTNENTINNIDETKEIEKTEQSPVINTKIVIKGRERFSEFYSIRQLLEYLENVNYSVKQCTLCSTYAYCEESNWKECSECHMDICPSCIKCNKKPIMDTQSNIICWDCDSEYDDEDSENDENI